jgi:hypothetical protein
MEGRTTLQNNIRIPVEAIGQSNKVWSFDVLEGVIHALPREPKAP